MGERGSALVELLAGLVIVAMLASMTGAFLHTGVDLVDRARSEAEALAVLEDEGRRSREAARLCRTSEPACAVAGVAGVWRLPDGASGRVRTDVALAPRRCVFDQVSRVCRNL